MKIDLQTGQQVPFTAGDKVTLGTKALQDQFIGIVGQQFISANVNATQAAILTNMTQQKLADLSNFISSASTSTVQYLHLAYDINGNTVTNFYLGIVTKIFYVPNNGQDIANAIHTTLLGAIIDTFPSYAYDAYIIGSPPMGTFHYKQSISTQTEKFLRKEEILNIYQNETIALAELQNKFLANIQQATQQAYRDQGINVILISANITDIHFEKKTYEEMYQTMEDWRLSISYDLVLDSDRAFQNSPIAPIVLAALILIAKIVAAAVVIGIASYLVVEWLKAMTTKTWSSEQIEYGWVFNPNTGEYDWKETSRKTESGTGPAVEGMLVIGAVVAAVAVVGILIVASKFRGSKK